MRKVIRFFVEQQPGVEVCAIADNGTAAVDAALALRPDMLILDLKMPGLSGIEVAGVLKNSLPETKAILFTMYGDTIGGALAAAVGVDVIAKSDGLPALIGAVKRLAGTWTMEIEGSLAQAIQRNEIEKRHLEALGRQLAAPLTRCGRDLKYMWVNEQYAGWLQRPVDKIIGRSILNIMGKNAFEVLKCYFEKALCGQDVAYEAEADYDLIGPQRISALYKPTFNRHGVPDGWLAFVQKIGQEPDVKN